MKQQIKMLTTAVLLLITVMPGSLTTAIQTDTGIGLQGASHGPPPPQYTHTLLPALGERIEITPRTEISAFRSLFTDIAPPAVVINLDASTGASPGTVDLSWIAPGDDGTEGAAAGYIVRCNPLPITEENWATSTENPQHTGAPAGRQPGKYDSDRTCAWLGLSLCPQDTR